MNIFLLPDNGASGSATLPPPAPAPVKPKRVRGPFDKGIMAALDEAEDVSKNAAKAPYAAMLQSKYNIAPAQTAGLLADVLECERLFGAARTAHKGSQSSTVDKDHAREGIIEAIDEFRTGARLSFKTQADMEIFGVGVDLERNSSVLAQLAQTILDDPRSPTLRGIDTQEMTALQTALSNWKAASGDQNTQDAQGEGDRARALALFDSVEARAREIKIAIDGKYSYKKPDSVETRKKFHLPLHRPFAPVMGE